MSEARGGDNRPIDRALRWFRANGPEATLSACMAGAGVSFATANRARVQLKKAGELADSFSPHDPGAGVHAGSTGDGPPPIPSPSRPRSPGARRAETLEQVLNDPQRTPPESALPADAQLTLNSVLERVLAGTVEALTPEQTLQYASELVRMAPTFQLRVMALREFNKMRAALGDQEELGPGKPLTVGERVSRAGRVLKACGKETAREVWLFAFEENITGVERVKLEPKVVEEEVA